MATRVRAAAQPAPENDDPNPPAAPAAAAAPRPALKVLKPTLLQRLNAVQREVDYVQKEKRQGMRYSIVSHDAVTAKVRPALVQHGVIYFPVACSYEQHGNRTQCTMVVRFANVDDASDYIDVPSFGFGIDDQDKGPGKAMSYAVKYALLKALGMETGDDPDYDQDVERTDREPGQRQVQPPAAPKADDAAAATAQRKADEDFIDGLILKMVKLKTKEALTELHNSTKARRLEIADRHPEAYKAYTDSMKQRAAEIDQGLVGNAAAA